MLMHHVLTPPHLRVEFTKAMFTSSPYRTRQPSSVTSTMCSQRIPPHSGKYRPGSTVTIIPGSSGVLLRPLRLGPSWVSSPTPCPSPCVKASATPRDSKYPLAALYTSQARTPGWIARIALCCASCTASSCLFESLRRLFTDPESPGLIGAVVFQTAPHIHQHKIFRLQKGVLGGQVVRERRVGAMPHNAREGQLGRPVMPEKHFNVP